MAAVDTHLPQPTREELAAFRAFLANKRFLIVDKSPSIRASVAKALTSLGAQGSDLVLTPNFEEAMALIEAGRAHGIVCDYQIGSRYGIELINALKESRKQAVAEGADEVLCVLVTGNSSQSVVAEAAEGDVDGYIIKPFTLDVLSLYLVRAGLAKAHPSNYRVLLRDGNQKLQAGELDDAIALFQEAKKIDRAPALACYHLGRTYEAKSSPELSEKEYLEGLSYNALHYRCSLALFDLYLSLKQPQKAYEVICRLAGVFPLSPPRLAQAVELAVRTSHFDDILNYYQTFAALDERRDDLIRTVCAALIIAGKHHIRQGAKAKAIDLFQKAAISSGGNLQLLREIIVSLAKVKWTQEAEVFLKRFPGESHGTPAYQVARFAIVNSADELGVVIKEGRELIRNGLQDPWVYSVLIERSVEAGYESAVETLVEDASKLWPNRAEEFKSLMRRS